MPCRFSPLAFVGNPVRHSDIGAEHWRQFRLRLARRPKVLQGKDWALVSTSA
jgi:hypothetical protein